MVMVYLWESGRVGNRHLTRKDLQKCKSFFCIYAKLNLVTPMVMVYFGESGRVGNRHLTSRATQKVALFFRILAKLILVTPMVMAQPGGPDSRRDSA